MNQSDRMRSYWAEAKKILKSDLPFLFLAVVLVDNLLLFSFRAFLPGYWPYSNLTFDIGSLILASALFALAKKRRIFLLLWTILLATLLIVNSKKYLLLDSPLYFSDYLLVTDIGDVVESWEAGLLYLLIFICLGLFAFNFKLRHSRLVFLTFPSLLLLTLQFNPQTFIAYSKPLGLPDWYPSPDYRKRGPVLFPLHQWALLKVKTFRPPSHEEVESALSKLESATRPQTSKSSTPGNLYIILVESWFDISKLSSLKLSQDPLAALRPWLNASQDARAYVHTFGGGTANSEFELLCGLPVFSSGILFMEEFNTTLPCLPRLLRSAGWEVFSYHANSKRFFRRSISYPKLGIDIANYHDKESYDLRTTYKSVFIPDEDFYKQSADLIAKNNKRSQAPKLHYLLTSSLHAPFYLDPERYPQKIKILEGTATAQLERYVNSLAYTSDALAAFVQSLRAREPAASIVVVGDHLPGISRVAKIVEASDVWESRAMPLLFFPPHAMNPKSALRIPLFQLPHLLVESFGYSLPHSLRDLRWFSSRAGLFSLDAQSFCRSHSGAQSTPQCHKAQAEHAALGTLSDDLLFGDQNLCKIRECPN